MRSDRENVGLYLKIPQIDTNEVGEYEVTVTSKLHAQAERTKKQKREDKAASSGDSDKDPDSEDGAQARGRAARDEKNGFGRRPECTG